MIFSIGDHIDQIKAGTKTQTRRPTNRYQVDRLYAIQPGRGQKGIPEGKIMILAVREEHRNYGFSGRYSYPWAQILPDEAQAEGGYTPQEFEKLYEKMYPGWSTRYAYLFRYYSTEALEHLEKGELFFPA